MGGVTQVQDKRRANIIGAVTVIFAIVALAGLVTIGGINFVQAGPAMQQADLAQLKTEVLTDPQALGYSGKSNFQIAQLLNTVGLSGETVDVAFVSADVIQSQVVAAEYLLLTSAERDLWSAMLAAGANREGVPVANANIRGQVLVIWGAGTQTRANLAALQTRSASRAEALFGDGTVITDNQVEEALLLP